MSLPRLAAAFGLAGAAALSGCAAYVTPHGRIGVGVSVPPVYVAPAPVYTPPAYYAPPTVYVAPVPRYYGPPPAYYGRPHYGPGRRW